MTSIQRWMKWLWIAGMVLLPLATVRYSWFQYHAHNYTQAIAAAHHVMVVALVWAIWSLGGLLWMQKFNKERVAHN
jgi:uncharacterized membrane protein